MQLKFQNYTNDSNTDDSGARDDKESRFLSWKKKRRELAYSEVGTPGTFVSVFISVYIVLTNI